MAKVCPSCELEYSDNEFFCATDGSPLRSLGAEADNLVGTVIADRYRIEAIIGEGGMGRVYRARHVRVPREAAIKVLRRALIADPYAVAAFNREARNAASVGDHPNVAAVYDFGETSDGLVFLAMEFVEGETLSKRLEREPVQSPARTVEIIRQIAAALTTAHELPEPVVHRDLKPDNILLKATRDGSDWVKVVDFGIAKAAKRETQLLTTPGLVVGTPRYMSPEQLTGGTIDVRSDIYALGIIAYQMLTGRMPFTSASRDEESTIQWALKRLTQQPLLLREVKPEAGWPAEAQDVFNRVLSGDAENRTGSATEFARALARAFGETSPSSVLGIGGQAPGPVSGALQEAARSTAPTAPLPATFGETNVGQAPAPRTAVGSSAELSRSDQPPRRKSMAIAAMAVGVLVAVVAGVVLTNRSRAAQSNAAAVAPAPNDSALATSVAPSAPATPTPPPRDSQPATAVARADSVAPRPRSTSAVAAPPASNASSPVVVARPDPTPPSPNPSSVLEAATKARVALNRIKDALADPDAVSTAGNGDAVLRSITRLLPTLPTRGDSVEANYYAVETNLILDRPAEACRILGRIRTASRTTEFEPRVERLLNDSELGCANRR